MVPGGLLGRETTSENDTSKEQRKLKIPEMENPLSQVTRWVGRQGWLFINLAVFKAEQPTP